MTLQNKPLRFSSPEESLKSCAHCRASVMLTYRLRDWPGRQHYHRELWAQAAINARFEARMAASPDYLMGFLDGLRMALEREA